MPTPPDAKTATTTLVPTPRPVPPPVAERRRSDVDEWGRSERSRARFRRLLDPLYRHWFRAEWEGLENIPTSGGALLVANHAGAVPTDAPLIMHGVETELGRPVYALADDIFRSLPGLAILWARCGGVSARPDNAYRLLREQHQLVLVFPEGTKGTGKLYKERYHLRRFGRGGFIEIAMRSGVPVVPISVIGGEEAMPTLARSAALARLLRLPYAPLTKQQIFEFYANWVDLGQRGSFAISGFAEASKAYFNKDLKDITLPEAALLAGIIQRPSYLSPYRHPERALERRNLVLESMVETHAITKDQAEKAKAVPLKLAPPNVEASDAPYFVDMVRDALISKFNESELNEQSYRIYTTLDPDLQKAAAQSVEMGIKLVDDQVKRLRTKKVKVGKKFETTVVPGPQAQVAMVVLDPHTGSVLALVGGRDYGWSQLNHAASKRPTGSIFKPFVYAAAMNTALDGSQTVITPASTVTDAPSSFAYGDQIYEPRNYKEEYKGDVTLRYALAMSLNNATVKVAEEVGYDKVADLAKSAGILSVKPTPAMALGSYDASPLDMAGAYTVLSNNGVRLSPILLRSVRNGKGDVIANYTTDQRPVLDPRVAYVMTNMMEGVINNGLGYTAVRLRGFTPPAAGKTGSSHDGWFAGYTSNLLCIVWVGYDDYSDLRLSGAMTAAPIWAEFMKKAAALPQYSNMREFSQPSGVVDVQLDKATNRLATPTCPDDYTSAFVAGTEPRDTCDAQAGVKGFFSKIFGGGDKPVMPQTEAQAANHQDPNNPQDPKKKKGFFGKIAGIFKDDKGATPAPKPADSGDAAPH